MLAGMPEENDGFAGALRELHPRGEGRPTVGLALRLLRPEDPAPAARPAARRCGGARVGARGHRRGRRSRSARSSSPNGLWGALRDYPRDGRGDEVATDGLVPGLESWLATPQVADAVRALRGARPHRGAGASRGRDGRARPLRRAGRRVGTTLLARRGVPGRPRGLAALSVLAIARGELPLLVAFSSVADGGPAAAARRLTGDRAADGGGPGGFGLAERPRARWSRCA